MEVIALQSGSNGNCVYVEAGGTRLLIDAGISGAQASGRLAEHGGDIGRVDAVLLSHDHHDHSRSVGIFQRKFKLPVYATRGSLDAARRRSSLGRMGEVCHFAAGSTLRIGGLTVETLPTPHDGVEGVAFVIDDGQTRLGVLTDLGHVFADLPAVLATLDAVLLESNYDPGMLARGRYPEFLRQRIRGPHGHLSNAEAAELLARGAGGRLQWACLGHLSEENNRPDVALRTHRKVLGNTLPLCVASRDAATRLPALRRAAAGIGISE